MNLRWLQILVWMLLYGAIWGVLAGALSGFVVSLILYGGVAVVGLGFGMLFGVMVGVTLGALCGLITLWFDTRAPGLNYAYRRTLFWVNLLLAPLLILAEVFLFMGGTATNDDWVFVITLMLLGAFFSVVLSRVLVNLYRTRFSAAV
jgi:hypothetical protein